MYEDPSQGVISLKGNDSQTAGASLLFPKLWSLEVQALRPQPCCAGCCEGHSLPQKVGR